MELKEEVGGVGDVHRVETSWLKPLEKVGDLDIMSRIYHVAKSVWVLVPSKQLGDSLLHGR